MVYVAPGDQDEGDLETGTRVCTGCSKRRPMTEFYRARAYRRRACKTCIDGRRQEDKTENPEKYRERDRRRNLAKYGLTPESFEKMLADQGGRCAICPTEIDAKTAHIDHNHETGRVRGLLDFNCNVAIGHLRDDPALVRRAADYLERET